MFAKIGSLSSGTDVIHEIAWNLSVELEQLAKRDTDSERSASVLAALEAYKQANRAGDDVALRLFVDEQAAELFERYLAPYNSFQSWVGPQGNDFGIQVDLESLMEDARYRNGVVQLLDGEPLTKQHDDIHYAVVVNDHGNVSLYDAHSGKEYWAVV